MDQISENADYRYHCLLQCLFKCLSNEEEKMKDQIRKMGLACFDDVNTQFNQDSLKSIDYFEDTYNLELKDKFDSSFQQNSTIKNVEDDVLLGIIPRLESKTNNLIKYSKIILNSSDNQDLKALRERNIQLTSELESVLSQRNILTQKLMDAEQKSNDYLEELKKKKNSLDDYELIKEENEKLRYNLERYNEDFKNLINQKEDLKKNKMLFENSLPDLEKTSSNNSSKNYLSKSIFSEELQNDVSFLKNQLEKIKQEKDQFLKELNKIKNEKKELENERQNLLQEIKLQKENCNNELNLAKKHFENQKLSISQELEERENEIKDYISKYRKLEEKLKEKENKEPILLKKIKNFQEEIDLLSEEKQNLQNLLDGNEEKYNILKKKNIQLQKFLDEYEKTKEKTEQVENELRDRLSKLEQALNNQLILNESLKKNQTEQSLSLTNSFHDHFKQTESGIDSIEQLRCNPADNRSEFIMNNVQPDSLYYNTVDCTYADAICLDQKNLQLSKCVNQLIKKNEDLNQEVSESRNLNSNLEKQIQCLNNQIEFLEIELKKISLERNIVESGVNEKRLKSESLRNKLSEKTLKENEPEFKVSLMNLKNKLAKEEEKVEELKHKLFKTDSELGERNNQIFKVRQEIENVRLNEIQLQKDKSKLLKNNMMLNEERSNLLQKIEALQSEKNEDDVLDESSIVNILHTVLRHKDEEIENLNCDLNRIRNKLTSVLKPYLKLNKNQTNLTLLDELINLYQKNLNNLSKTDSYESLNSLETLNYPNTKPYVDKNFETESSDEDICDKLVGIHNNSIEICNLSQSFRNEKSLTKLIKEIPKITTSNEVTNNDLENWKTSFVNCFSNKEIAKLLVNNIVAIRPIYFENLTDNSGVNIYKEKFKLESLKVRKLNVKNKSLVFQKKYLKSLVNNRPREKQRSRIKNFRSIGLAIIAGIRIKKNLQKIKCFELDFDKNFEKNELITYELDKINQLNNVNFLYPSLKKHSSLIKSLNPSRNTYQADICSKKVASSDSKKKGSLEDLFINLREVGHNIGLETETTLSP